MCLLDEKKSEPGREGRGTRMEEEAGEWSGGQWQRERDYYSGLTAPSVGTVKLLVQTEYGRGRFKGSVCAGIRND